MEISIDRFRELSKTAGVLRPDSQGGIEVYGKGMWGKVVKWFRMRFKSGTINEENRKIMASFVRALSEDSRYGERYADMAKTKLSSLIRSGKPISARKIGKILEELDTYKKSVQGFNRFRAYQVSKVDSLQDPDSFGSIFKSVCQDKGVDLSLEDLEMNQLRDRIMNRIMVLGKSGKRFVSLREAKEVARAEIERFVDRKVSLLTHIDSLSIDEGRRNVLRELVLKNEHIKRKEYISSLLAMQDSAKSLLESLSKPNMSRRDIFFAFYEFNTKFDEAINQIGSDEIGGSDVFAFSDNVFEVALKGDVKRETLEGIYERLSRNDVLEMKDALMFIASTMARGGGSQIQSLMRPVSFIDMLFKNLVESLGRDKGEIDRFTNGVLDLENASQIPDDIADIGRDLGVRIPPANPFGRSGKSVFSNRFRSFVENLLTEDLQKYFNPEKSGHSTTFEEEFRSDMVRDMGRATYSVGGEVVSCNEGEDIVEKVKEEIRNEIGDKDAIRALSIIAHQGILGCIYTAIHRGLGPFAGIPGDTPNKFYDISCADNGDIRIMARSEGRIDQIVRTDGKPGFLDPNSSYFNVSCSIVIPAESVRSGSPRAIVESMRYDYSFNLKKES